MEFTPPNLHQGIQSNTVCADSGRKIAITYGANKKEYAKIFSASGDMLEALQQGAELMEYLINATPTGKVRDTMCDFNIIARSAIAKALD